MKTDSFDGMRGGVSGIRTCATPLGLEIMGGREPRVGLRASGQPWAGMHNPVGVEAETPATGLLAIGLPGRGGCQTCFSLDRIHEGFRLQSRTARTMMTSFSSE